MEVTNYSGFICIINPDAQLTLKACKGSLSFHDPMSDQLDKQSTRIFPSICRVTDLNITILSKLHLNGSIHYTIHDKELTECIVSDQKHLLLMDSKLRTIFG